MIGYSHSTLSYAIINPTTSCTGLSPAPERVPCSLQEPGEAQLPLHNQASPRLSPIVPSCCAKSGHPFLQQAKQELEWMDKLGVIARVEQPTNWCAGMGRCPKTKWEGGSI